MNFLQFTRDNWRRLPRFVLFAGDSSYDPKNYLGYGDSDLVPTKLYDSAYMEAASDDWFVDFQGTGLPEIASGRLVAVPVAGISRRRQLTLVCRKDSRAWGLEMWTSMSGAVRCAAASRRA